MSDIECLTDGCTKEVTQKVADYSQRKFNGKIFCFECQKEINAGNKPATQQQENPPTTRPEYKGHGMNAPHGNVLSMDDKITLGQAVNLVYAKIPVMDLDNQHHRISFKTQVKSLFELIKEIKEELK